jgi:hypothetical protein
VGVSDGIFELLLSDLRNEFLFENILNVDHSFMEVCEKKIVLECDFLRLRTIEDLLNFLHRTTSFCIFYQILSLKIPLRGRVNRELPT